MLHSSCTTQWLLWMRKKVDFITKIEDVAGLEPTRDKPNRFLVDRLNHSATVSLDELIQDVFTANLLMLTE